MVRSSPHNLGHRKLGKAVLQRAHDTVVGHVAPKLFEHGFVVELFCHKKNKLVFFGQLIGGEGVNRNGHVNRTDNVSAVFVHGLNVFPVSGDKIDGITRL